MRIGIVGLGLIGGTIAKSLNKKHIIEAYDIDYTAVDYAKKNNIIDKGYDDLKAFLANNQIIFLCLYPKNIAPFFKENIDVIKHQTLFIEISGIKTSLIKEIESLNINHFDIVYTHPIAGRETIGIQGSDKAIFKKANFVIIDNHRNCKTNVDIVHKLAVDMGFRNINNISAEYHDKIIAYTSQLTHVISLALVNSFDQHEVLCNYTGDSYRDLTRIANINIDLWTDLFINNKSMLLEKITDFEKQIKLFKNALENNDIIELETIMKKAKRKHNIFLKEKKNES